MRKDDPPPPFNGKNVPSPDIKDIKGPPPGYEDGPPPAPPDITAAFANLNLERKERLPTVDQCIAHLKLLEAINQLREDVGGTDGLYGLSDSLLATVPAGESRDKLLVRMREKRWAIYVLMAARRFETWFQTLEPGSPMINMKLMESEQYKTIEKSSKALAFTKHNMPPLDVLMIWHSFTLNPRKYFSDCVRNGKVGLWRAGMPWNAVAGCVDNTTFNYQPPEDAQKAFTSETGLSWDSLTDPPTVTIECPSCKKPLNAQLTLATDEYTWTRNKGEGGDGYADPAFKAQCSCGLVIDHEVLRAQRFRKDLQLLLVHHVPMPGTLLSLDGLTPRCVSVGARVDDRHNSTFRMGYPNRLLLAGAGAKIADMTQITSWTTQTQQFEHLNGIMSVDDIRKKLEASMKDVEIARKASLSGYTAFINKEERIAIRRMMACYWENASLFSLDLVGATIRQNVFVTKMHDIDWLHSPAVRHTMERLIKKYENFFKIMRYHPKDVAVPTLDVDLAWHTHQLDCPMYRDYSVQATSIFIDHDDKIDENKLSTAFEWTSKIYEKTFGEVYSECTCWYCEAIREAHTSRMPKLFKSKDSVSEDLSRLHAGGLTDPHKSPHISAHNAIKSQRNPDLKTAAYVRNQQLERNYQKAVRRAKKEGRVYPRRDDYYYYPYWGMYYPMPFYAPYMGNPCMTGGMYPANPGCANFGTGAMGNCCAGACGGAVAAGGCAGGSGAGSCGGGAGAGACAGAGGGGFGGCGGGGGGAGGCGGGGGGGGCGGGGGGGGGGCGGGGGGG